MGGAKDAMIEAGERGWTDGPDKYICAECAVEPFLAAMVSAESTEPECDYCGATSPDGLPIAAPFSVFMAAVGRAINWHWTDPAEELPYESREGGYQGQVIGTIELLADHVGVDWEDPVFADVAEALPRDYWCKRHYFELEKDERLRFGWREFEHTTKHESRYAALLPPLEPEEWEHPDDIPARSMLDEVANCIRQAGLVVTISAGTGLFRARDHSPEVTLLGAADLGAPLPEQALHANRMSAAGIAVFYGAFEEPTAIVETLASTRKRRRVVTTARFQCLRDLRILNLCELPRVPSYFDVDNEVLRYAAVFLRNFVKSVSRSTTKDGREHIDYVPTQIFAEYVRHRLRVDGETVHGIVYPSVQAPRGRCCVLFCDQSACVESDGPEWLRSEQWLRLDPPSVTLHAEETCRSTVRGARKEVRRLAKRRRRGF